MKLLAAQLAEAAKDLHTRGWMLATSGNLSAVVEKDPLRLLITPSGKDKGELQPADLVCVDTAGRVVQGEGRPSDELPLHLEIVAGTGAGAVVHTHSVWGTLLSREHAADGGLTLTGYEMLKALSGVATHDHSEWLPIIANSQDYDELRVAVAAILRARPAGHGLLLAGHGLYSWGKDLQQARRHTEALEFLLEVVGRGGDAGEEG